MAAATTIRFGTQALLIEWTPDSGTFTAPCGITSLTKTTNVETNTVNIPDCDDPDLASWLGVDEISRQIVLSFGGVLAQDIISGLGISALGAWQAWDLAGGYKNVRWYRNLQAANGGGYLWGPALLTAFEETGEAKQRFNMSGTVTFDGKPTWVAAA